MTSIEQPAMPRIASKDEWRVQRLKLLEHEKEATRQTDRVSAERRRMPMVQVDKEYFFEGPTGRLSLTDLFEGRRQLIVYHFMFDPEWDRGCSGCSAYVDSLGDLSGLNKRNTTFVLISRAPLQKLDKFKAEKGWSQNWVSSYGSAFNYDFHATMDAKVAPVEYNYLSKDEIVARGLTYVTDGEQHSLSVFFRTDAQVFHSYQTFARGVEKLTNDYALLDVTPWGRQEDWEDSPEGWPQLPTYG